MSGEIEIAAAGLGAAIGSIGGFLGLVSSGLSIIQTLTAKPSNPDFYTIRMEIGNNQDAGGNPPSIILNDFANTQVFGVFQGNSKKPDDQCRNNKDLPIGDLDSPDNSLFNGLRNAEAPVQTFKTNNGYNLKSLDIQPGGNAVCVSNIILKGSDTQARRDEVFIPIGDLGFQCGFEWNWGTVLGNVRQRCVWLDGQPDNGNKPIQSLSLDMEKMAGIFNKGKNDTLSKATLQSACALMTDNVGKVPNRNACKTSFKRTIAEKNVTIDSVPLINQASTTFGKADFPLDKFVGSPFVTTDNKIFNIQRKTFDNVAAQGTPAAPAAPATPAVAAAAAPGSGTKAVPSGKGQSVPIGKNITAPVKKPAAKPAKISRAFAAKLSEITARDDIVDADSHLDKRAVTTSPSLRVERCTATTDGAQPVCSLVETIQAPAA